MNENIKIPPQALDLEQVVLGALLLERDSFEKVREILSEDSFYSSKNAKIYAAIKYLNNQGEPVDLLTVSERLKALKFLDEITPVYIAELTNKVASSAHIEKHARIIAQKYIQRELIRVSSTIQNKAYEDVDPIESIAIWDDLISLMDRVTGNDSKGRNISEITRDSIEAYDKREELRKSGLIAGIPSFSGAITDHTNGWQSDNLIVIAGRPGSGKTAYALAEAKAASKAGKNPCFFSLEMSDISLADRLLIAEAEGLDQEDLSGDYSYRFRKGYLNEEEKERLYFAHKELSKVNLFVDDKAGCNLNYISKVSKSLSKKGKCDMIIIDYLQLLTGSGKRQNREQEVSEMTRGLKLLAKELGVPVFLLAQLNREVEKRPTKQPIMADLRESGSIEQDADIIIFPFRPIYYIDQDPAFEDTMIKNTSDKYKDVNWKKTAIMIFAKDRANGPTKILVEVNKSCTTWKDTRDYIYEKQNEMIAVDLSEGFENVEF